MALTNKEKLVAIASHLDGLSDEVLELYLSDAEAELSETSLAGNERAIRYMAAHFATLNVRRASTEQIDDLRVSYETAEGQGLQSTKYGQELERMMKEESGSVFRLFS